MEAKTLECQNCGQPTADKLEPMERGHFDRNSETVLACKECRDFYQTLESDFGNIVDLEV